MKKVLLFLAVVCLAAPLHAQQRTSLVKGISTTTTMQNAATGNGNGTVLDVDGQGAAVLTVNCSSCSGGTTVNFEGQNDGSNFTAIYALNITTNAYAQTLTTSGLTYWRLNTAGLKQIRARISAYSAGTITVTGTSVPLSMLPDSPNTDQCDGVLPTTVAISVVADTVIISASSGKKNHICGGLIVANSTAEIVNIVEGTGSTCGSGTTAIIGSTTDANGVALAASGGGFTINRTVAGIGTNVDTCLRLSGTNRVSGFITYVQVAP